MIIAVMIANVVRGRMFRLAPVEILAQGEMVAVVEVAVFDAVGVIAALGGVAEAAVGVEVVAVALRRRRLRQMGRHLRARSTLRVRSMLRRGLGCHLL